MATLCLPAHTPIHLHAARRLHFSASSDGLLLWLSEECWCRGLILLAALVAAVALTLRRRKDTKYFDPGLAVKTRREDRIRIVSMAPESSRAAGQSAADNS